MHARPTLCCESKGMWGIQEEFRGRSCKSFYRNSKGIAERTWSYWGTRTGGYSVKRKVSQTPFVWLHRNSVVYSDLELIDLLWRKKAEILAICLSYVRAQRTPLAKDDSFKIVLFFPANLQAKSWSLTAELCWSTRYASVCSVTWVKTGGSGEGEQPGRAHTSSSLALCWLILHCRDPGTECWEELVMALFFMNSSPRSFH